MPFSLVSDVLTDPRGKTYNVFNQHSKRDRLKKQYKHSLQKQINKFLRTADDDVDKYDVARYLEKQGMTNDRITNSGNSKDIVKHALDNKPISLSGAKKKKEDQIKQKCPRFYKRKSINFFRK